MMYQLKTMDSGCCNFCFWLNGWRENQSEKTHLHSRSVDFEFLEDSKGFFVQFTADGDVGDVRGVVVVQSCDVLHHTRPVRLDGRQDQQVLQIPVWKDVALL